MFFVPSLKKSNVLVFAHVLLDHIRSDLDCSAGKMGFLS